MDRKRKGIAGLFKPKASAKNKLADAPEVSPAPALSAAPQVVRRDTSRLLPKFQATANDQPNVRSSDRIAAMRAKLRHAFTPSQPIADRRMFAGREDVLRSMIGAIEDQRLHVVIYGERGIGKTSLLHMLTQAANEARYIVIYTSCGAGSNFDDIFRAAAVDIPILFHSGFAPTNEQAERGATLADLLPKEPVTPRQFGDLCSKLTGTRVLIVLDEFDRCENVAFRRDIAELIKNLSDRLGRVQLVLAGVAADLTELVTHIPSIRRNIWALRIPKMNDEEVLQIVSNGEKEVGFTFEPSASDLLVTLSRGSPYVANLLGHHAGQNALNEGRQLVTTPHVLAAAEDVEADFAGRVSPSTLSRVNKLMDEGLTGDLDCVIGAALAGRGPFNARDLQRFGDIDVSRGSRLLESLAAAGLLVRPHGDDAADRWEFTEEALPTYLWLSTARADLNRTEARAAAGAGR